MYCLDRGAPLNRLKEERKEYPLHMAARLGDRDVGMRVLPLAGTHTAANIRINALIVLETFQTTKI